MELLRSVPSPSFKAKAILRLVRSTTGRLAGLSNRKCLATLALVSVTIGALLATVAQQGGDRFFHSALMARPSRRLQRARPSAFTADAWLPEYLNYTGERCEWLLQGDPEEKQSVKRFLKAHKRSFWCHRDRELGNASCEQLRTDAYGGYSPLADELDFRLAYALRVHECATQVELLLRAIYSPHNFYCIHADGGAAPSFLAAMHRLAECLPNVRLAPVRDDFVYRSVSQMEADVECMHLAQQSDVPWRYFLNVAGQELPLKSNYELVRELRALNGSSHVNVHLAAASNRYRWTHSYWCRDPDTNRTLRCQPPLARKPPPPGRFRIWKSSAYGAFSRAFVDYMLEPGGVGRQLYDWFSDTLCPEEHYFATLVAAPTTPGGYYGERKTRAVQWRYSRDGACSGRYVRDVCIFRSGDLPRLLRSPFAFANKFYFQDDPVAVRCLVESVQRRKARPDRARIASLPLPPLLPPSSNAGLDNRGGRAPSLGTAPYQFDAYDGLATTAANWTAMSSETG